MGTPAFAGDILASLLGWPEFSVQAVFTLTGKPDGAGALCLRP
jgi:methionyl-tRNA formyltransferase